MELHILAQHHALRLPRSRLVQKQTMQRRHPSIFDELQRGTQQQRAHLILIRTRRHQQPRPTPQREYPQGHR